ncbi:hypothetical protein EPUL_000723 [Erysiphe pulchra]|uniref:Uncharacterized protein n=1 Tax=Erysiphe pulchra TaxID=225359 RepID=A0A2S4PYL4_9PEZI|nr:hypothetical protein EPUL_000723 [Erysiphe pulchra]
MKNNSLTIQQIEFPEAVTTLVQNPYLCSSIPAFQVENYNESIRNQCQKGNDSSIKDLLSDDLDTLENIDIAGANSCLGALKQNENNKPKIHRDQLVPPPKSWKELMCHPYKD